MKSRNESSTTSNESSCQKIVCVYTQNDESFYRQLQTYLSLWQRERFIQWLETPAGSNAEDTMQAHLKHADLILLLISPDFFAQDPCYTAMKTALQEQAKRQVPVVPILARASAWKGSACGSLHTLPEDEQPIAEWRHPEQAYEDIRSGLVLLLPGDDDYKQKLMQKTGRRASAYEPGGAKNRANVQAGNVTIDNKASNYGVQGSVFNAPIQFNQRIMKDDTP